jgi:hypothetical protein
MTTGDNKGKRVFSAQPQRTQRSIALAKCWNTVQLYVLWFCAICKKFSSDTFFNAENTETQGTQRVDRTPVGV